MSISDQHAPMTIPVRKIAASGVGAQSSLKRVLIISPAFAPSSTPDSQRVRMSLPYYRENGWEPIVLAVELQRVDAPLELPLLDTIPADTIIHHCFALDQGTGRRFGLGNLGWRAWWPILLRGAALIKKYRIDLVFFSTTQFALLPLGRIWKNWLDVPFVVDLQDPWRTDYYERPGVRRPPGGWKYQGARLLAALLEPWSLKPLSGLISVSENYVHELRRRYTWFRKVPAVTLGFGASEHDLQVASQLAAPRCEQNPQQLIRFVYTGAAGPITPHAVSVLFEGLRQFRDQFPEVAARLRFEFIGTSYAPAGKAVATILPLAEKFNVADLVAETPSRVGHLECIRAQAEADVLLLLGSSDRAYSPSKLYPYFLANRPMLSVVFWESILEKLLIQLSCSHLVRFEEHDQQSAVSNLVAYFRQITAELPAAHPASRNETYFKNHYLARTLTAQQTKLFERALAFAHGHARTVI